MHIRIPEICAAVGCLAVTSLAAISPAARAGEPSNNPQVTHAILRYKVEVPPSLPRLQQADRAPHDLARPPEQTALADPARENILEAPRQQVQHPADDDVGQTVKTAVIGTLVTIIVGGAVCALTSGVLCLF